MLKTKVKKKKLKKLEDFTLTRNLLLEVILLKPNGKLIKLPKDQVNWITELKLVKSFGRNKSSQQIANVGLYVRVTNDTKYEAELEICAQVPMK